MKKYFSLILLAGTLLLPSCMDNVDEPNTDGYIITNPKSVGDPNTTILEVKERYCSNSANADNARNQSNFFSKVLEDLVIEGVVVANDVSGNLYQTILIRKIDSIADGTVTADQAIQLIIKNTCLYPFFPLGQRLHVNLKNLHAGCYSKTPRIGEPYYSSYDNLNLGPMPTPLCETNIHLVGLPDPNAPELVPLDFTATGAQLPTMNYKNSPQLAKVRGKILEVQGDKANTPDEGEMTKELEPLPKIYGPEELHDKGWGVDRTIQLTGSSKKVALRTSTGNEISFTQIPTDERTYTGMFNYYDGWQIQVRDLNDITE